MSESVAQKVKEACEPWDSYTESTISFSEVAKAWVGAGLSEDFCASAMIVVGGECEPVAGQAGYCDVKGSAPSGIAQCDSCRGYGSNTKANKVVGGGIPTWGSCGEATAVDPSDASKDGFMGEKCDLNLSNPCINLWGLARTVMIPGLGIQSENYRTPAGTMGCVSSPDRDVVGSASVTQLYADSFKKSEGSDQYATSYGTDGFKDECNYIGGFCHWQYASGQQQSGTAWSGGNNNYQWAPFPYYYYELFLDNYNGAPGAIDMNSGPCYGLDLWGTVNQNQTDVVNAFVTKIQKYSPDFTAETLIAGTPNIADSDKGLYKSDAQGNPDPSGDEIWSSAAYREKTVNFTKSWDFCVNHVGKEKLEAEAFSAAHEACGT